MRTLFCFTGLLLCSFCRAQTRPPVPLEPTSTNLPANLPAQPVGTNDLLMISVYDAPELSRSVRVGADGYIRIPMLKQRIKAEGALPAQLEHSIAAALVQEGILVDPVVTVGIAEYHSRPISVAGAVRTPERSWRPGPLRFCRRSHEEAVSKRLPARKSLSQAARKRGASRSKG
jgi:hypothetical protein